MLLTNSGTESVEAALKIARAATGRPRILYCDHAFHGLTLGSLSVNGNEEFRDGFGPLLPGCDPVPFGDPEALRRELARGDVAAFIVEPVQGKGVQPAAATATCAGAQELCRADGALFVVDEVQTGLGRTGRFLALEHWGSSRTWSRREGALRRLRADRRRARLARSVFDAVFDAMERGVRHGSTFGGNDLAAAAALATLQVLDRERLVERAERLGELLLELTRPLVERFEVVREVRGLGLIWAIELGPPSGPAARRLWERDRAPPARPVRPAGHRAAVPRAPHPLPGRRPPHERRQGAAAARDRGGRAAPLRVGARGGAGRRGGAPLPQLRKPGLHAGPPHAHRPPGVRALVTGAGGFIGAHVAAALGRDGAAVRGFDLGAPPPEWRSRSG